MSDNTFKIVVIFLLHPLFLAPGPRLQTLPCSTQPSMKPIMPITAKLKKYHEIFLQISAENVTYLDHEPKNANICWHFRILEQDKFHAQSSRAQRKLYNPWARSPI